MYTLILYHINMITYSLPEGHKGINDSQIDKTLKAGNI